MVKFQTRLMVGVYVLADVLSTVLAWVLAYFLRFNSDLVLEALPATNENSARARPPRSKGSVRSPLLRRSSTSACSSAGLSYACVGAPGTSVGV